MTKIWKPDGSKSMDITDTELMVVKAMLCFLKDDNWQIPQDYKIRLGNRMIPVREISLEKPQPKPNMALDIDF